MIKVALPHILPKFRYVTIIAGLFLVLGLLLQITAFTEVFTGFSSLQDNYWINSKTLRDSATTGNDLTKNLAEIKTIKSEVLTLKLVGISSILTGIFIVLVGILGVLKCPQCSVEALSKVSKPLGIKIKRSR